MTVTFTVATQFTLLSLDSLTHKVSKHLIKHCHRNVLNINTMGTHGTLALQDRSFYRFLRLKPARYLKSGQREKGFL